MRLTAYPSRAAASDDADDVDAEGFRLVSIGATPTPSGCSGRDWFVYRIAQGGNFITGYRRGTLESASAEVETIVTGLNERRRSSKPKPGRKPGPRGAAIAQAPTASADEPEAE